MKKIVCFMIVVLCLLLVNNGCYSPTKTSIDIPIDHRIVEILERAKNQAEQETAEIKVALARMRQDYQAELKRQEEIKQNLLAEQKRLEEVIAKQEQVIQDRQAESKRQETVVQDLRTELKRIIEDHQAESKRQETAIQNLRTEQKRLGEVIQNNQTELKHQEQIIQNLRKEAEEAKTETERIRKAVEAKAEDALQDVAKAVQQIVGPSPAEWSRQRDVTNKAIQDAEKAIQKFSALGKNSEEWEQALELMNSIVEAAKRKLREKSKTEEEIVGTWLVHTRLENIEISVKINETTQLYEIEPKASNIQYDGHKWSFFAGGRNWSLSKVDANTFVGDGSTPDHDPARGIMRVRTPARLVRSVL